MRPRSRSLGPTVSETAYRALRDEIRTCALLPGRAVSERQIGARLGVGLLPARNALARLTEDGLVRRTPRSGYRIAPLTPKSVDDLFLTWRLIGPEIARLGIHNATAEDVTRVRRMVAGVEEVAAEHATGPRAARFLDVAGSLYGLLAVLSSNHRLLEAYRCLDGEMSRIWFLLLAAPDGAALLRAAPARWRSVLDDHDGDQAATLTRAFIDRSHSCAHALPHLSGAPG